MENIVTTKPRVYLFSFLLVLNASLHRLLRYQVVSPGLKSIRPMLTYRFFSLKKKEEKNKHGKTVTTNAGLDVGQQLFLVPT